MSFLHLGAFDTWARASYILLWNKGPDALVQSTDDVEHLPQCMERGGNRHRIMIRDDYSRLWDEIIKYAEAPLFLNQGMVVFGHPGIGKSFFLIYALARALGEGRPVIFSDNPAYYLHFDGEGIRRLPYGPDDLSFPDGVVPHRILTLVDSNSTMRSPPVFFLHPSWSPFIVQATSPQRGHYSEWAKERRARIWVMETWTADEIRKSGILTPSPNGCYTPIEIFDYLGPSARDCCPSEIVKTANPFLDFSRSTLVDVADPIRLMGRIDRSVIEEGSSPSANFHKYFFVIKHPGALSVNFNEALPFDYTIPTRHLRLLLFRQLEPRTMEQQEAYCSLLSPLPKICGPAYEVLGVRHLASGLSTIVFKSVLSKLPDRLSASFPLPVEDLPSSPPDLAANFSPVLWIPPTDFPAVDAVAVTDGGKRITLLQMTIASQHQIKAQGIAKLWLLCGDNAPKLNWEFIFVVPSDEIGLKLCQGRPEISQRCPSGAPKGKKIEIPVGYGVVPFLNQIRFKSLKDNYEYVASDDADMVIDSV